MSWTAVPHATAYRYFGPGIAEGGVQHDVMPDSNPAGGYRIHHTIWNLPAGSHTYRVASVYGPAGYVEQGTASTTITVVDVSARYRITVNGFRAVIATNDDPILHRDGKGDEIFIAAFVGSDLTEVGRVDRKIVRTRVYGDVNNFPDRIRAGSSSATGGIGPLNWVPANADQPIVPMSAMTDRLPLLVWEGELSHLDRGLAVVPTVWEWDGDPKNYDAWSGWLMGTRYDWRDVLVRELYNPGAVDWYPITLNLGRDRTYHEYDRYGLTIDDSFGKDLPMGYEQPPTFSDRRVHASKAIIISRSRIERTLGTQQTVIFPVTFTTTGGVGGRYDLYLQLERLPRTSSR
jgi:hypothetical protein